jgi:pyrrolidone-carboxylate peptidase
MADEIIYLTGFEPFLNVEVNASGEIAGRLNGAVLDGVEIASTVLPVTFAGMPPAFQAGLAKRKPLVFCSLGVQREGYYRLEQRARPNLNSVKPDQSGVFAEDLAPLGSEEKRTSVDSNRLLAALRQGGAEDARTSTDAGGYVCERCYWELLSTAEEQSRLGVFLHVPPVELVPVDEQVEAVRAMLRELIVQARKLGA